jgi:drug/metabolite transporter (DMT)-like permease
MRSIDIRVILAFFAIYVVWGSTYLAIRIAVETIPPLATAGIRHLCAGAILFVAARGFSVRITAAEWRASLVVGVLFFLIGHGTLHWAEQTVPSGVAALLVATEPIWIAMLMPADRAQRWSGRMLGGLAAGLIGVGLLAPGAAFSGGSAQLWGSGAILLGALSWAVGVRYSSTAGLPSDPFVRTATTLLCGAALLLTASALSGELGRVDVRAVSGRSLLGLGYLILFGSVVAFSAYTWLLDRCPATLVATHTYVNPAIAVLLGWLFAGEALTLRVAAATVSILVAVLLLKAETRTTAAQGAALCRPQGDLPIGFKRVTDRSG